MAGSSIAEDHKSTPPVFNRSEIGYVFSMDAYWLSTAHFMMIRTGIQLLALR